jgi:AAA15 family ATPase/GTPase
MKNSFELLAIITKDYPHNEFKDLTKGFERHLYFDFLKVLQENTVYSINSNFNITYEKDKKIRISKNCNQVNLYSNTQKKINIQVNAIVGKNGSGKSTLSEILYLMLYNLAIDKVSIYDENKEPIENLKGFLNAYLLINSGEEIWCLDFEILNYFIFEYSQKNDSKNIRFFTLPIRDNKSTVFNFNELTATDFDINKLYYMISLNYSMYGLNELKMGKWIKHIFHKNDMYKAPIVINPYREYGRIDVNTEDTQSNARIISNLSRRSSSQPLLSQDYKFDQLNVIYKTNEPKKAYLTKPLQNYVKEKLLVKNTEPSGQNYVKIERYYSPFIFFKRTKELADDQFISDEDIPRIPTKPKNSILSVNDFATILLQNSTSAFKVIHSYFYNIKNDLDLKLISTNIKIEENRRIIDDLFSYFICKLFRIGVNYNEEFGQLLNSQQNGFNSGREFEAALIHVLTSDSHACFKLKRIYFFLNFSKGKDTMNNIITTDTGIVWTLNELKQQLPESLNYLNPSEVNINKPKHKLKKFYSLDQHYASYNDLAWRIPPPIFQTKCILKDIKDENKRVDLNELSSGETQFIYALQTILYHIININSNGKYGNIVLLLDEIELYYHPEYQRVFLNTLLQQIKELTLSNINNIQIIFLTHSPFVLSDIPSSNILRLDKGRILASGNQTFGANLYDLLKDDFFLKNGVIGDVVRERVSTILAPEHEISQEDLDFVELIGDPLLKGILTEKINARLKNNDLINRQIEKLKDQLKQNPNVSN